MRFLRMKPGHGEVLIAEGDVEVPEEERELVEAFRRQLDEGMWAAVPTSRHGARREAEIVRDFSQVPRDAERVIFFPRAAGGAPRGETARDADGPRTAENARDADGPRTAENGRG